ncbi:hypothetical protein QZM15_16220 [Burkholderia sp. AU44665]|uniref:hypothetical protein n=1 Tax=Burkholderia sp. AU44665 TaxID=3059203 RepID=UPI00265EFC0E|nr:hypothetical protein [Burkholderia sp. AU44665]MDN7700017.1 hypothetical protein [Burkholderia sp. AU44665]
MKKFLSFAATAIAVAFSALSAPAHAQFNASNSFSTINTQCGTYFLQGSTYYNWQGVSVGSTLPYCGGSLSSQNSGSVSLQPAKYTNATLPTCNASSSGLIAVETDGAASPVYAATATGGGTLAVQVMCTNSNGSYSWTNH